MIPKFSWTEILPKLEPVKCQSAEISLVTFMFQAVLVQNHILFQLIHFQLILDQFKSKNVKSKGPQKTFINLFYSLLKSSKELKYQDKSDVGTFNLLGMLSFRGLACKHSVYKLQNFKAKENLGDSLKIRNLRPRICYVIFPRSVAGLYQSCDQRYLQSLLKQQNMFKFIYIYIIFIYCIYMQIAYIIYIYINQKR